MNLLDYDLPKMVSYLNSNKEWLFSGIGLSAFAAVFWIFKKIFFNEKTVWDKSQTVVKIENVQTKNVAPSHVKLTSEVAGIVTRFNQILALFNKKNDYNKFTIARFAQILKLESVGELESIFQGKLEPSFEFISKFCNSFGIYENWLIEGKVTPFCNDGPLEYDPMGYLKEIDETKPDRIYFILCDSEIGETFLLLKFSDWRYKTLRKTWHISSHVGAGGRSQIFSLYQLIKHFQANSSKFKQI